MRILLVVPPRPAFSILPAPDIGLAYVARAALDAGATVRILDAHLERFTVPETLAAIGRERPDLVAIKCLSMDHRMTRELCAGIKRLDARIVTVLGGPHPTAVPELLLDSEAVDFIISGEGEGGFRELVRVLSAGGGVLAAEDRARIPGLICRDGAPPPGPPSGPQGEGDGLWRTPPAWAPDLQELGFPAWHLFPIARYPVLPGSGGRFLPILTTRGCPCGCRFCASPVLHGRAVRRRPIGHVFEEIRWLVREFQPETVSIFDDNFAADPEHAAAFCREFRAARLPVRFDVPQGLRLDTLTDATIDELGEAGCGLIGLGIESGSQASLDRVVKGLRVAQVEERIRQLKARSSIPLNGFFILGFPHETVAMVKETIAFALRLPLDFAGFTIYTPFPGTPMFDEMVREGYFTVGEIPWDDLVLDRPTYRHRHIGPAQLKRLQTMAYLAFYLHPRRWRFFARIFLQEGSCGSYFRRFLSIAGI